MNTILNPIPSSLQNTDNDSLTEARGFIARCKDMIERVRASLIRADNAYRAQRASIVHRYNDELDALDKKHDKTIAEHQTLIAKLEELRS